MQTLFAIPQPNASASLNQVALLAFTAAQSYH
jgi:hypothetical protein